MRLIRATQLCMTPFISYSPADATLATGHFVRKLHEETRSWSRHCRSACFRSLLGSSHRGAGEADCSCGGFGRGASAVSPPLSPSPSIPLSEGVQVAHRRKTRPSRPPRCDSRARLSVNTVSMGCCKQQPISSGSHRTRFWRSRLERKRTKKRASSSDSRQFVTCLAGRTTLHQHHNECSPVEADRCSNSGPGSNGNGKVPASSHHDPHCGDRGVVDQSSAVPHHRGLRSDHLSGWLSERIRSKNDFRDEPLHAQ